MTTHDHPSALPLPFSTFVALPIWLAAFLCISGFGLAAEDRRPNIVFILADDLGYGDVGCYGASKIRTPNIDAMARDGVRFTHFAVAQAVCTASRAALMSGCYPNRVGLSGALNHTSPTGMAPSETLLSEICKSQGYATGIFGKWHLGHQTPFLPTRQGFDVFAGLPYSNDNGPLHPTVRGIPALPWYENETITERDPDQSQFTKRITSRAVSFIQENRERPFFLYLPHIMPHVPIFASAEFKGKSGAGLYGDVVEELDWSVGEVLKAIREAGIAQHTLVIFSSDNGPFLSYGEHAGSAAPLREGKLTTFEGGVRTPFIAQWPGTIGAGRVEDRMFAGMDLLPTLTRIVGGKLPEVPLDGEDLSALLLGRADARGRDTFFYYSGRELHAVRRGKWKLHLAHDYIAVDGEPGRGGKPANYANMKPNAIEESGVRGIASRHGYRVLKLEQSLFDLGNDPGETRNVAAENPAIVTELMALMDGARKDLGDSLTNVTGANCRPVGDIRASR